MLAFLARRPLMLNWAFAILADGPRQVEFFASFSFPASC